jgi:hypothetical protein
VYGGRRWEVEVVRGEGEGWELLVWGGEGPGGGGWKDVCSAQEEVCDMAVRVVVVGVLGRAEPGNEVAVCWHGGRHTHSDGWVSPTPDSSLQRFLPTPLAAPSAGTRPPTCVEVGERMFLAKRARVEAPCLLVRRAIFSVSSRMMASGGWGYGGGGGMLSAISQCDPPRPCLKTANRKQQHRLISPSPRRPQPSTPPFPS